MSKWFVALPQSVRLLLILLLYAGILVGHIAIVNIYTSRFSYEVDSREVVVTTREIPIHTVISEDDVTVKRVLLDDLISGVITDPQDVIGKESQVALGKNEQLNASKINTLVKNEGEMILEIPGEWLLSYPKSMRRLDKISFLPVLDWDKLNAKRDTNYLLKMANGEILSDAVTVGDLDKEHSHLMSEAKTLLKGITVAYFKDNSANEITDSPSANSTVSQDNTTPRINTSNIGTHLEVALTEQQWELLNILNANNYKFVVSYQ